MATYAIGDVQGCYQELQDLLDKINFNQSSDQLLFCGDLVNRGPASLEVLRFVKQLGNSAISILGNHDIHLIAIHYQLKHKKAKDTLDKILSAPDRDELISWLKQRPLLYQASNFTLIHAGLPPQWDLQQAMHLAREVESVLQSKQLEDFLNNMYGNKPDIWSDTLSSYDRFRFIINCYSRLRYCNVEGQLSLKYKGPPGTQPDGIYPWFTLENRKTMEEKILFGHWSTIKLGNIRNFKIYNVYPLDTGCLWGGELTAFRLDDEQWFSVPSRQPRVFK